MLTAQGVQCDRQAGNSGTNTTGTGCAAENTLYMGDDLIDIPVLDRKGRIRHEGGVTPVPGLYAMGLPFMRKRKSGFIFGAGDDARGILEGGERPLDERCVVF